MFSKGLDFAGGHKDMVRRQADLAGIQGLDRHDPARRVGEIGRARDDHRRFSAEFEGDGRQVLGGRPQDMVRYGRAAGKDQVVEGQAGKGRTGLGSAKDDSDSVSSKALAMSCAIRAEEAG